MLRWLWSSIRAIKFLAEHNIGLNLEEDLGMTALHWAAGLGELEIASVLLEAGADENRYNWFLVTPYELAVWNEQKAVAKALTKKIRLMHRALFPEMIVERMKNAAQR